jgi:signal peptidase
MKRIIKGILTLGIIGLLAGIAWFMLASPYELRIVYTGSMSPAVPPRSAVVVDTRIATAQPGQVYTFNTTNGPVTHRLVRVEDGHLITKGDANASEDSNHAPISNIIGKVVYAPRELGFWLQYCRNPFNWAGILLLLFGVPHLWASDKKQRTA